MVEQELVTCQEEWRVQVQDMEKSCGALQDRVRELELEASVGEFGPELLGEGAFNRDAGALVEQGTGEFWFFFPVNSS